MLAVAGQPPDNAGWAIEMKWDGVRAIAVCSASGCRLYSRNARDVSGSYPELATSIAQAAAGRALILDGEIIAKNDSGAPSFGLLQQRMHVVQPTKELIAHVPVNLYIFDVLAIGGEDTTPLPYLDRRAHLTDLDLSTPKLAVPQHWTGTSAESLLVAARQLQLEGIVSKQLSSPYRQGTRSLTWIKTALRQTTEAIVVGWTEGTGAMSKTFGSLALAAHDPAGRLTPLGFVGTGFKANDRRALRSRLDELTTTANPSDEPLARSPWGRKTGAVHWVRPELVADVEYREYTGGSLRHPSWRGLRNDKAPAQVDLPGAGA